MTREEKAVYYKHNGCNCCQSVIKAMIDLSDSDKEILTNAASGFAVGMEATCGALIGATMMAGIVKPGKKSAITAREILNKFQEYSGATICKDLKGKDTGVVLCECDDCIRNAIRAFDEVLLMESERER
ncbi:C-GCAxxG-C-C family protein [Anaerostipes sp.]|uniref:C-GCAxxG-C-C family protein n=1 Tax=Anaerostipes sp. TaxID=1872530 RepID=UPI00258A98A9|nr:C-GCAxxG-C-C family protein [Anaerostipes sp.]